MSFELIKKNFGFGCMRLPMKGEEVDYEEFNKMIDMFIENGFNYFDTAHPYLRGKSEPAIRDCLASRYDRSKFLLTNKLSGQYFNCEEDIRPLFHEQLKLCGVEYFDFYLMHAQNRINYQKFKKCNAYKVAFDLKKEGLIKHVGLSFHDKPEILDMILSENPEIEVVQIQFNYIDYESLSIESKKVYEVARKHNKPIIIMEPVKGGNLVNLPKEASKLFDDLNNGSNASYALRYAAGFDGVIMTLSGMGSVAMMEDNIKTMKNYKKLNEKELETIDKVVKILRSKDLAQCTNCKYCVEGCPMHINIPDLLHCLNSKVVYNDWSVLYYYNNVLSNDAKASKCIKCGKCELTCPQGLKIRDLLDKIVEIFEK